MLKRSLSSAALILALAAVGAAQNANSSTTTTQPAPRRPAATTTRRQTTTTTTTTTNTPAPPATQTPQPPQPGAAVVTTTPRPRRATSPARAAVAANEQEVRATFDALLRAVEKRDVDAVMLFYWNSPQLTIFNNNGTVTRGWTQMHANLASLYPELKDVKIDARDVKVLPVGTDGAVVTCLWTQTQEYKGTPETSSGRMTLMFRRVGGAWKIAHRHTSPDAPDPSRLPASEQSAPPVGTATPRPPAP
ncbi:MAG TPA: nuclear transport factor 2 family protein [Pyrinomonadaceae bacterium]